MTARSGGGISREAMRAAMAADCTPPPDAQSCVRCFTTSSLSRARTSPNAQHAECALDFDQAPPRSTELAQVVMYVQGVVPLHRVGIIVRAGLRISEEAR